MKRFGVVCGGKTLPGPSIHERRDDSSANTVGRSKGRKQENEADPEKHRLLSVGFSMGMGHKQGNYGKFACDGPSTRYFPCYTQSQRGSSCGTCRGHLDIISDIIHLY